MLKERISGLSVEQRHQIIKDHLQFEEDGQIGDCEMRRQAVRCMEETSTTQVVPWMHALTFETLLSLYKEAHADSIPS